MLPGVGSGFSSLFSQHRPSNVLIHLVVIAWLYVAVMMSVAEATASNGTVLGAVFTFLLYGLIPVALLVYLMLSPARRRAAKLREAQAQAAAREAASALVSPAAQTSEPTAEAGGAFADAGASRLDPDASGQAPADAVPPVREKP